MIFTGKNNSDGILVSKCILGLGVIGIVLLCFSSGISGNDFWWHIKVGEYICQNHQIPRYDIFSWLRMENEIPWTAHEWLSEVILYVVFQSLGEKGIFFLSIGMAYFLVFLAWHQIKDILTRNYLLSSLFFGLFAVLTSSFFYGRPHIFSFLLLFLELKILYDFYEKDGNKSIYLVPIIAVLWSNLHGGSSNLSYLLCMLFAGVSCVNLSFERVECKRLSKISIVVLGVVSLCSMAAILVNPIGIKVFCFPYENINDALSMKVISEWQAPDIKEIGHLILYFAPIAIISGSLLFGKKCIRLIDLVIMIFFVYLFMRSVRFIILWYIAAVFYSFPYFTENKIKAIKSKMEWGVINVIIIGLVGFSLYEIGIVAQLVNSDKIIKEAVCEECISVVQQEAPKRLYNDYNFGETLIYHDIPVFFDARADMYSKPGILADGIGLMLIQLPEDKFTGDESVFEKYDFDAFLIGTDRPLYFYLLSHSEKYTLIYKDEDAAYFRVVN